MTETPTWLHLVLEGEFLTAQDILAVSQTAPLYVLAFGLSSLFLGLLFRTPVEELRKRATVVKENEGGGTGTILRPFAAVLLCIASLMDDEVADNGSLETMCDWLDTFPQSKYSSYQ